MRELMKLPHTNHFPAKWDPKNKMQKMGYKNWDTKIAMQKLRCKKCDMYYFSQKFKKLKNT